jgi:hypothetical protein
VRTYLRNFFGLMVALAGIAALYVGAVAIQKTLYFWIVIGASAVIAGVRPGFKGLTEIAIRFRNYPKLLERVTRSESEVEQLNIRLRDAGDNASKAWMLGLKEGYARTMGAILSLELESLPEIVGIADDDGTIALMGQYGKDSIPQAKARFKVVSRATGDLKGMVEVTRTDDERSMCLLRCVSPIVERFWQHLAERVSYDESAPSNVVLERYEWQEDEDADRGFVPPYSRAIEGSE